MIDALATLRAEFAARFDEPPPDRVPRNACGCVHPAEPTCPARLCVVCCPYAHDANHQQVDDV